MLKKTLKSSIVNRQSSIVNRQSSIVAILASSLILTACGGGGSDTTKNSSTTPSKPNPKPTEPVNPQPDPKPNPTKPVTPKPDPKPTVNKRQLKLGNHYNFAWQQGQLIQIVDNKGKAIANISCHSDNPTKVTVSKNCSAITANRLGKATISITAKGKSSKITINGVPARMPLPLATTSQGNMTLNRVVTTDGKVLTWGANDKHIKLGAKNTDGLKYIQYPRYVVKNAKGEPLTNIQQVANDEKTTYYLNNKGEVYYRWDRDLNDNDPQFPVPLKLLDKDGKPFLFTSIVASAVNPNRFFTQNYFLMGLTDTGQIVVYDYRYEKTEVVKGNDGETLTGIQSISVADSTGYAIDSQGRAIYWDLRESAREGDPTPIRFVKDKGDKPITGLIKIVSGTSSKDITYETLFGLTKSGQVYAWGGNVFEVRGDETLDYYHPPEYANLVLLDGKPLSHIKDIVMTDGNAVALSQSGNVYAWGRGTKVNLLGLGQTPSSYSTGKPQFVVSETGKGKLSDVVALTTYDFGILALKKDGTLVGWGKNLAGQLTHDEYGEFKNYDYPKPIQSSKGVKLQLGDISQYDKLK